MSHLNQSALSTNGSQKKFSISTDNKSLYGLKQAPRIWYLFLCGVVGSELGTGSGFLRSRSRGNHSCSLHSSGWQNKRSMRCRVQGIEKHFKVEYKGPVASFLGIDVIRNWDEHLCNRNHTSTVFLETLDLRMPNQQAHHSTHRYRP